MKAPRLTRRLTLQDPVREADGAGGFTLKWVALGALWAEVVALSGRETAGNMVTVSTVSYRILVRAAPVGAPSRPRPGQRFVDGKRIYHIEAVAEHDPRARYLICFAQEEVPV